MSAVPRYRLPVLQRTKKSLWVFSFWQKSEISSLFFFPCQLSTYLFALQIYPATLNMCRVENQETTSIVSKSGAVDDSSAGTMNTEIAKVKKKRGGLRSIDDLAPAVQFALLGSGVFFFFGIHNVLQEAMMKIPGFNFGVMLGYMEVIG